MEIAAEHFNLEIRSRKKMGAVVIEHNTCYLEEMQAKRANTS